MSTTRCSVSGVALGLILAAAGCVDEGPRGDDYGVASLPASWTGDGEPEGFDPTPTSCGEGLECQAACDCAVTACDGCDGEACELACTAQSCGAELGACLGEGTSGVGTCSDVMGCAMALGPDGTEADLAACVAQGAPDAQRRWAEWYYCTVACSMYGEACELTMNEPSGVCYAALTACTYE